MNSILFSVDPKYTDMNDAIDHLRTNSQLYFEVRFPIKKNNFVFPLAGFIHLSGGRVSYVVKIEDILSFSPDHYDPDKAKDLKPFKWIQEYIKNLKNVQHLSWKHAFVITKILPYDLDTYSLEKKGGGNVSHPPQKYVMVLPPVKWSGF